MPRAILTCLGVYLLSGSYLFPKNRLKFLPTNPVELKAAQPQVAAEYIQLEDI